MHCTRAMMSLPTPGSCGRTPPSPAGSVEPATAGPYCTPPPRERSGTFHPLAYMYMCMYLCLGKFLLISLNGKGGGQSTLPNDSYAYISIFGCFAVFSNDFSDGSMNVMFQVVCEGGGVSGR